MYFFSPLLTMLESICKGVCPCSFTHTYNKLFVILRVNLGIESEGIVPCARFFMDSINFGNNFKNLSEVFQELQIIKYECLLKSSQP